MRSKMPAFLLALSLSLLCSMAALAYSPPATPDDESEDLFDDWVPDQLDHQEAELQIVFEEEVADGGHLWTGLTPEPSGLMDGGMLDGSYASTDGSVEVIPVGGHAHPVTETLASDSSCDCFDHVPEVASTSRAEQLDGPCSTLVDDGGHPSLSDIAPPLHATPLSSKDSVTRITYS